MSDDPAKPPRFPIVAALLCAACVGAAVWGWMRYSYCWEVTYYAMDYWQSVVVRGQESFALTPNYKTSPVGAYVCLRGDVVKTRYKPLDSATEGYSFVALAKPESQEDEAWALVPNAVNATPFARHALKGRVRGWLRLKPDRASVAYVMRPYVDTTASRLHGASIAGLVVGAMGVFVFSVALRHWLMERRRFREDTRGHNTVVERTQDA